jgi:hypothetical protein
VLRSYGSVCLSSDDGDGTDRLITKYGKHYVGITVVTVDAFLVMGMRQDVSGIKLKPLR